jgi:hypothetical protein
MKIKLVVVDLELSPRARRIVAATLVPAVVLSGGAIAYAGTLHAWADGDTLTATDLNGNFKDLDGRVSTLETAKTADEQSLASQGSSITKLQAVAGAIFKKNGNDGTVPCDAFCPGTQWGPSGTCVAAFDTKLGQFVSCSAKGSMSGPQLTCYCSQFSF